MNCQRCGARLDVLDTRMRPDGVSLRRRRRCPAGCGSVSTIEQFADTVESSEKLTRKRIARLECDLALANAKLAAVGDVFPSFASIDVAPTKAERAEYVSVPAKPNALLDALRDITGLKSDLKLAQFLGIGQSTISAIRLGQRAAGDRVIQAIHAKTNLPVIRIKAMAAA